MQLENNVIKKAVFGAVEIREENGTLKFFRFTEKQRRHFVEMVDTINKPLKMSATANMLLDFYTDSTSLKIATDCVVASGQDICWFDVYVDGSMKEHFGYTAKENRSIMFDMKLKPGKKRVTIFLPCLFGAGITGVWLDDGSVFEPAVRERKILVFGDSITQGYISEYPSLTYTGIVMNALNAECINQAIGGAVFDVNDLDEDLPYKPDTVFVAYGTNDWSCKRSLEKYAVKYFDKLTHIYKDSKIYVILPIWRANAEEKMKSNNIPVSFEQMHEDLKNICARYSGIEVIDGMELMPHSKTMLCEDGVHPNELGFIMYGTELLKRIHVKGK